jgi:hypothetical protein
VRLRLKDKHAQFLGALAREVNFVWNYCNELQLRTFSRERRFLSGYDFAMFTVLRAVRAVAHKVSQVLE